MSLLFSRLDETITSYWLVLNRKQLLKLWIFLHIGSQGRCLNRKTRTYIHASGGFRTTCQPPPLSPTPPQIEFWYADFEREAEKNVWKGRQKLFYTIILKHSNFNIATWC
jgi:hypothetical protein